MTDLAVAETRAWVERAVIGLRMCPFAPGPHAGGRVRYAVSAARDREGLLNDLGRELTRLLDTPPERIETTLLIHPQVLVDFLDYNDFLADADELLQGLDLEGVIQIASFHPDYLFAGSTADDIANATNRSPYPMLQLLREASIERALAGVPRPEAIYEANVETLRRLGAAGWDALRRQCRADADAAADGVA
jgi:uncharacterized protein